MHDLAFVGTGFACGLRRRVRRNLQLQHLFLFAAEHRQDTVRGQLVQRLAEIEIVLEFFAFGFLASSNGGRHPPVRPHLLAQRADQVGVFGKTLHQDRARPFQRCGRIGHLPVRIDETFSHHLRIVLRLRQQQFR